MDTKNTLLGIFFFAAGMLMLFMQSKNLDSTLSESADSPSPSASEAVLSSDASASLENRASLDSVFVEESASETGRLMTEQTAQIEEAFYMLSNDYIRIQFTNQGGAIQSVQFLQSKRGGLDDYEFNKDGMSPAFDLNFEEEGRIKSLNVRYELVQHTDNRIEFVYDNGDNLKIFRRFSINEPGQDPYVIKHETVFKNSGDQNMSSKKLYFNMGTTFALNEKELPNYLTVGTFDGSDSKFTPVNKLTSNGLFSGGNEQTFNKTINRLGRFEWVALQNQYFTSLIMPSRSIQEVLIRSVYSDNHPKAGLTSYVSFDLDTILSNESRSIQTDFYVGPKEFKRLQVLGDSQDKVMQFGWFGFFSKLLLFFMSSIHSFIPNWGWSIVVMTILIKLIFWPLTAKASESQKAMAKIQAPMAELKKKYENNPQKMQQETLKLFKENGVNPFAGCLPILIQMPIFLGLFYMLRSAAELRYESFLWVTDLSQADTVAVIAGFPINLFPILMGITMFAQMQLTPVSPTADPLQQKIFKFMPFIFLVFLYNFSSGLVVYWTTQNILTIIQQKMIMSKSDPVAVKDGAVQNARPIKAKVNNLKKK